MNILIVDDEPIIIKGISKMISGFKKPYVNEIFATVDTGEALEILSKKHFDCVITDMNMPIMNGIDFIKEINSHCEGISIIALSGYDDYKYVNTAYQNGISYYLLKPVSSLQLQDCIENINTKVVSEATKTPNKRNFVSSVQTTESSNIQPVDIPGLLSALNNYLNSGQLSLLRQYLNNRLQSAQKKSFSYSYIEIFYTVVVNTFTAHTTYSQVDNFIFPHISSFNSVSDITKLLNDYITVLENVNINENNVLKSKISEYIENNYNKDISLTLLSNHLSISYSHFSRIFKKLFKMNFIDYLISVRMMHAKDFLEKGNYKIDEVATLVGYKNPKSFSKAYKDFFGHSPKHF